MSLFDVLRYRINPSFTVEDLKELPQGVVVRWWHKIQAIYYPQHQVSTINISEIYDITDHDYRRISNWANMNVSKKNRERFYLILKQEIEKL